MIIENYLEREDAKAQRLFFEHGQHDICRRPTDHREVKKRKFRLFCEFRVRKKEKLCGFASLRYTSLRSVGFDKSQRIQDCEG